MRFIWWLLQLAVIALALPGRNHPNNLPKIQPRTLLPSSSHVQTKSSASVYVPAPKRGKVCLQKPQTVGPLGPVAPSQTRIQTLTPTRTWTPKRTSTSKSVKACKSKPPSTVIAKASSRTRISTSTPSRTSTTTKKTSYFTPACYGLPAKPNPGPLCVCTNGLTTRMTVASECPTVLPSDWTTPTPQPTTTTSQIPFSYYNWTNGALVHCASSVVSKLDIYTGIIETYCAGSTSTDSNTPGVTSTTSLWPATESPVTWGNWGYYTADSPGTTFNSTLAAFNLAGSFYTAFSSLCTNTATPTITTTTTISLNTLASLPGGARGAMTTITQEATYYHCDGGKTVSVAPWYIAGSNDFLDQTGTLAVSIIDSQYSVENLDTWLWSLAFRYAHATVTTLSNQTIALSSSNEGGSEESQSGLYPFFKVPTQVQLIFGDSLNDGVGLERLTGQAVFEMSEEEQLACEIAEEIMEAFEILLAFAAGPEAAALGIGISEGVRGAVQVGIDAGNFFLGCPPED